MAQASFTRQQKFSRPNKWNVLQLGVKNQRLAPFHGRRERRRVSDVPCANMHGRLAPTVDRDVDIPPKLTLIAKTVAEIASIQTRRLYVRLSQLSSYA